MAIAWSRISSKLIADPPCALRFAGDRVGMGDAVGAHVYHSWLAKESGKCGGHAAKTTRYGERSRLSDHFQRMSQGD
jgi:hypothetical protein